MRHRGGISGRLLALFFLAASVLGTLMGGTASAQETTRITSRNLRDIRAEAEALRDTPRIAAMSEENQIRYLESYVLYAIARDAGVSDVADLTPAERDQAQRLVGAVESGAVETTTYERVRSYSSTRSYYTPTRTVIETTVPRTIYLAPPAPVVLVPAPSPVYYVSPAPVYVIPSRHHKWGW